MGFISNEKIGKVWRKVNPLKAVKPAVKEPELTEDEHNLLTILSWRRGYQSLGVTMLEDYIQAQCDAEFDPHGNLWVTTDVSSRVLFTAHTDTVHALTGTLMQEVIYDPFMKVAYKSDGDLLGADDGAGVWLLLEMIKESVPGTYVFFTGEERGGIGSRAAARDAKLFEGFDQAIAFDRKGTSSVITHQFSRCCSDAYGKALSDALTEAIQTKYLFEPDDGGTFTDTANLTELIPECTNISVGYEGAHGPGETLDVDYLFALRDACLVLDWTALPIKRDPAEVDYTCYGFNYDKYGSVVTSPTKQKGAFGEDFDDALLTASEISAMGYHQVVQYVIKHPELASELLQYMADEVYWANEKLNQAYEKMTMDLEEEA